MLVVNQLWDEAEFIHFLPHACGQIYSKDKGAFTVSRSTGLKQERGFWHSTSLSQTIFFNPALSFISCCVLFLIWPVRVLLIICNILNIGCGMHTMSCIILALAARSVGIYTGVAV